MLFVVRMVGGVDRGVVEALVFNRRLGKIGFYFLFYLEVVFFFVLYSGYD